MIMRSKYIYNIGVLTVNVEFMRRGLETGKRRAFSESFQPFRAEPHKFYIYRQYANIVYLFAPRDHNLRIRTHLLKESRETRSYFYHTCSCFPGSNKMNVKNTAMFALE